MGDRLDTSAKAGRGTEEVPQPSRVHIVRVDYEKNELFDADGNGYYELPGAIWAEFGPVREGSVRYWGSGSHAGHINLLPLAQYRDGEWVSMMPAAGDKQQPKGYER